MSSPTGATLAEVFRERKNKPGQPFLTLLDGFGTPVAMEAEDLFRQGLQAARFFRDQGLEAGDRVMLLVPNGIDFIRSLLGAILGGLVPVIYPPPQTARNTLRYVSRLKRILGQSTPSALVLSPQMFRAAGELGLRDLRLLEPPDSEGSTIDPHRPLPADPALIQYSSGSTGDPKGVLLSHRAILANAWAVNDAIRGNASDTMLSWLPLCHDMGLFGGLLFPWICNWRAFLGVPHQFLVQPAWWLQKISQHRATLTIAPNFAYSLCVHGIEEEELQTVSLNALRVAFNGAEPIRKQSVDRFIQRFSSYGLRPQSMFPVYGMAENTLAVAFPPVQRGPRYDRIERGPLQELGEALPAAPDSSDVVEVASVGIGVGDCEIRILDEHKALVGDRCEGEVWLRSSSMLDHYYGNPEASSRCIQDGWLATGDKGYFSDGELYITGRRSDVIIRAGRNYHPHDLESVVEEIPGVRRGCVAALGIASKETGTEEILVLAETRQENPSQLKDLAREIRLSLSSTLGVRPEQISLLPPRTLPKTSSGKLQRRLSRELIQAGKLSVRWTNASPPQQTQKLNV